MTMKASIDLIMALNLPSRGFSKQRRAYSFVGDIFRFLSLRLWARNKLWEEKLRGWWGFVLRREQRRIGGQNCRSLLTGLAVYNKIISHL